MGVVNFLVCSVPNTEARESLHPNEGPRKSEPEPFAGGVAAGRMAALAAQS